MLVLILLLSCNVLVKPAHTHSCVVCWSARVCVTADKKAADLKGVKKRKREGEAPDLMAKLGNAPAVPSLNPKTLQRQKEKEVSVCVSRFVFKPFESLQPRPSHLCTSMSCVEFAMLKCALFLARPAQGDGGQAMV